jgi:hypothetical protein
MADGGIGVKQLTAQVNYIVVHLPAEVHGRREKGRLWHFQMWSHLTYSQIKHSEDVFMLNLNLTRIEKMTPFYVSALKT